SQVDATTRGLAAESSMDRRHAGGGTRSTRYSLGDHRQDIMSVWLAGGWGKIFVSRSSVRAAELDRFGGARPPDRPKRRRVALRARVGSTEVTSNNLLRSRR